MTVGDKIDGKGLSHMSEPDHTDTAADGFPGSAEADEEGCLLSTIDAVMGISAGLKFDPRRSMGETPLLEEWLRRSVKGYQTPGAAGQKTDLLDAKMRADPDKTGPPLFVGCDGSAQGVGLKLSVSVFRKSTICSSSLGLKPRLPTVLSRFAATSGAGQQVTFSPGSFGPLHGPKVSRVL
jgi:hypothetical protein